MILNNGNNSVYRKELIFNSFDQSPPSHLFIYRFVTIDITEGNRSYITCDPIISNLLK